MTTPSAFSQAPVELAAFNQLLAEAAFGMVRPCLNVERWLSAVVMHRPYPQLRSVLAVAGKAAFPFTGAELEAGVAGRSSIMLPTDASSEPFSGSVSADDAESQDEWVWDVHHYEQRFGRPFLICAVGRSRSEVVGNLRSRLSNDLDTEDLVLAYHLRQIALRALADALAPTSS